MLKKNSNCEVERGILKGRAQISRQELGSVIGRVNREVILNPLSIILKKILFPYISYYFHIPKIFDYFFSSLEKIGIDEKVICYHNISN